MKKKQKKLLTGRRCNWKDIKINEVFAYAGCWTIAVKLAENKAMVLAADADDVFEDIGLIGTLKKATAYIWSCGDKEFHTHNGALAFFFFASNGETMFSLYPVEDEPNRSRFFKLSKSIQSLFKVE